VPVVLPDFNLVLNWDVLIHAGHSPAQIRAQLDAGRWRRWGFAIVLHNGPLSRQQQWYVARIHGGRRALLTGFTAAEACGLQGWERDDVDVLIRQGSRGSPSCPVSVRWHRVRDWSGVRRYREAAIHLLPQALLIAAGSFVQPRPACGILAAAVQQRLVTPTRLMQELEASPRLRHRRTLRGALADIAQGSDALSEIDFVRLCRRHGLPPPEQQTIRPARSGRRRYLDATWRRKDGRLIVVEVDGALHLSPERWWKDQLRQNELALANALVLRFPSVVVRTEPTVVAAQLRAALQL
jgi:hypothetical protein